jgi:hypothetical protein
VETVNASRPSDLVGTRYVLSKQRRRKRWCRVAGNKLLLFFCFVFGSLHLSAPSTLNLVNNIQFLHASCLSHDEANYYLLHNLQNCHVRNFVVLGLLNESRRIFHL